MSYASNAIESQDFKFEIGNADSPLTYTEVKEITGFTGFDGSAGEIDKTHLQSDAKEFLMGLQDYGNFNIDVNYLPDDTGQGLMRTAKGTREIQDFQVTLSDNTTFTFKGYVMNNPMSGSVDDKVSGSFNVRISGDVTQS